MSEAEISELKSFYDEGWERGKISGLKNCGFFSDTGKQMSVAK